MKIEDIHLETKDGVTTLRIGEIVAVVQVRGVRNEDPNYPLITNPLGISTLITWDILDVLQPPEARAEFLRIKK